MKSSKNAFLLQDALLAFLILTITLSLLYAFVFCLKDSQEWKIDYELQQEWI
jgi:competence protein ComGF